LQHTVERGVYLILRDFFPPNLTRNCKWEC